jgi:hypothetical protein
MSKTQQRQRARPATPRQSGRAPNRAARRRGARAGRWSGSTLGWVAVGTVVAIVAALVVVKVVGGHGPTAAPGGGAAVPAQVLRNVTGVPASAFDAVGAPSDLTPLRALPPGTPPLLAGSKPKVVYIGAEYCPYCAAQRWAVVVALSRFGSFSGLGETHSSTVDVFPGTRTFTFHGASYTSPYVAFSGVETETNTPSSTGGYTALEPLTPEQRELMQRYDLTRFTGTTAQAIPFLDVGGRYVLAGSSFSPQVLQGMTMAQIAQYLRDPNDPVARAILGSANLLTAAICDATGGKPGMVCASPGVVAAKGRLSNP